MSWLLDTQVLLWWLADDPRLQAMVEGMTIVTADRHFALYNVPLVA